MRIVLIGSGNVATHLADAFFERGVQIVQVYSRTVDNARALAQSVGASFTNKLEDILPDADFYIFSVKDDALAEIISQMPATNGVWAHTAGSVPVSVFEGFCDNFGVLYPLQTFSKNRKLNFAEIPVFVEANNAETLRKIGDLATMISRKVQPLSGERRRYLHLAAVFGCNFVNHLYALAAEILEDEQITFDALKPLITETAAKVMELSPHDAQTGPAVRFDEKVIQKHIDMLKDPKTKQIYRLLSEQIYEKHHNPQKTDS